MTVVSNKDNDSVRNAGLARSLISLVAMNHQLFRVTHLRTALRSVTVYTDAVSSVLVAGRLRLYIDAVAVGV